MTRLRIILGIIFIILGFIGDFLPILPGPLLSFIAIIFFQIADKNCFTTSQIIILGVAMAIITTVDYVTPIIGTKKMGGTKRGTRGSTIGLIVGVIILPLLGIVLGPFGLIGLLGGPFVGAYIGEILYQKHVISTRNEEKSTKRKMDFSAKASKGQSTQQILNHKKALKAALGSFIGFLGGILLKVVYTIIIAIYLIPRIRFAMGHKSQVDKNYREVRESNYTIPQEFKIINKDQYYKIRFENTKVSYSTGENRINWFYTKDKNDSCHTNNKPVSILTENGKLYINILDTCGGGSGDGYISKLELKKDGNLKLVGCYRYDNRGQFENENNENGNRYFEGTTQYEKLNKAELSDCEGNFDIIYYKNIFKNS